MPDARRGPDPNPDPNGARAREALEAIRRDWRRLAGGRDDTERATLVALSGGADSSALLIALAGIGRARIVAGHVCHPMRPAADVLADRAAAADLCARLGVPCLFDETGPLAGNAENAAREARYARLVTLAGAAGVSLVATGHHADDQAETVLMRLIRGTGPGGLAGIRASRRLGEHRIIRPMLRVTRGDAEAICRESGWAWAEDRTNREGTRLRARLRHEVMPALRAIAPDLGVRLSENAWVHAGAARAVGARAERCLGRALRVGDTLRFGRADLRDEPPAIRGEVIRRAARDLVGDHGADTRTARRLRALVGAIGDTSGESRVYQFRSLVVRVSRDAVDVEAVSPPRAGGPR